MDIKIAKKIDVFFTKFKHQAYRKGEILIRADDSPSGVFYLKEGRVKEYAISKKGDELVVNIFKPISFFPMSWAVNGTPNSYYYETVTEADVWRAPKEKTVEFIKNNSDVLFDLLSRVYRGTDGLLVRMTYLMSGGAYGKLITELLIHARRFGKKGEDEISVKMNISEKEIAAQAGMSRETVSRELKILKGKKLVLFNEGTLIIPNVQILEEELF